MQTLSIDHVSQYLRGERALKNTRTYTEQDTSYSRTLWSHCGSLGDWVRCTYCSLMWNGSKARQIVS